MKLFDNDNPIPASDGTTFAGVNCLPGVYEYEIFYTCTLPGGATTTEHYRGFFELFR
ncbi:MAG TPA: hypothetical protein VGO45_12490 [Bacteroidia bacterium]|nr:hypothetical protein [Bacteroidia bacterium]